jgi:ApaG protein
VSKATTRGVRVEVRSAYVEEQSSPEDDLWFFAYHVTISNVGQDRVQLLTRHWVITDGDGQVREPRPG